VDPARQRGDRMAPLRWGRRDPPGAVSGKHGRQQGPDASLHHMEDFTLTPKKRPGPLKPLSRRLPAASCLYDGDRPPGGRGPHPSGGLPQRRGSRCQSVTEWDGDAASIAAFPRWLVEICSVPEITRIAPAFTCTTPRSLLYLMQAFAHAWKLRRLMVDVLRSRIRG